jgi:sulfite reductase beta subunit-like hemoprotein
MRLSYGLYYQLDHTSHMQRIKIPGGMLSAEQMEAMADVADRYGRGIAHVTTRQDIQIHWVPVDGIIDLYERLLAVGITTRGACADSVRNVTACPYAGTAPTEPFDVGPYCLAIHDYFLFNPLNLTLPRKFKIAIEGCVQDCAQGPVNDIGLYAKVRDGAQGFSVFAGGGLGAQPFLAKPLCDFIPAEDLLIWCEAVVRIQHRFGSARTGTGRA